MLIRITRESLRSCDGPGCGCDGVVLLEASDAIEPSPKAFIIGVRAIIPIISRPPARDAFNSNKGRRSAGFWRNNQQTYVLP